MAVHCPYCQHSMNVKSARPGRFNPKCSKCGRVFLLTVSAGPGAGPTFTVAPAPGEAGKSGAAFDPEATVPPVAEVPVKAAKKGAGDPDATQPPGAFGAENPEFSLSPQPPAPAASLEATEADLAHPAPPPAAPADGAVPEVLGNYQILKELGRGGMGAVYLARQISLDRPVALKVMNPQWAKNPAFLVRFTREAYAAAQLVHHNVVQVYDIGADQGINYFSMEYVQGQSLAELLKQEKKLDPATAAGYILQAARGLKFAHDRGMIHRDIKPDNLMLNDQGIVKVADLGLVRTPGMADEKPIGEEVAQPPVLTPGQNPAGRTLGSLSNVTMAGQAMGTPSYMSPEEARDATKVDHRADLYSLGCTLYVLVTGRPVFKWASALEVITKHASDPA